MTRAAAVVFAALAALVASLAASAASGIAIMAGASGHNARTLGFYALATWPAACLAGAVVGFLQTRKPKT